jgi:hypothetical protein
MTVSDTHWWGGHPYGEAYYVNIAFLLILATQSLLLACAELPYASCVCNFFLHISYDPRVDYCNTRTVLHY